MTQATAFLRTTLIKMTEAQQMMGVSRPTIYRWLREGRAGMPEPVKIGPNSVRFRLSDIEAFIQRQAAKAEGV